MEKNKTYMDKLMTEKDFREKFDQEYQCIAASRPFQVSLFTVRIVCPFLDYPARRPTPAS